MMLLMIFLKNWMILNYESIFPRSGSIPEDPIIKSSGFRFIVHKNYLIFYSIEESEKTVRIRAVFNSRQDYMRVITKFI